VQPINVNVIIRCQKIALQSLIDMKPSEWRDCAIARLSKLIAEQEAAIAAQETPTS
jgi:hypothetical protein